MIVVGVDPGATFTGVVVRRGNELLHASVMDRTKLLPPGVDVNVVARRKAWSALVVDHVEEVLRATIQERTLFAGVTAALLERAVILAVENVVKPRPHGGMVDGRARVIDPGPIIDTAIVVGRLLGSWPALLLVEPNRNGSSAPSAYPEDIRPGRRGLGGPPEHARSAWDVAGAAAFFARVPSVDAGGCW